MRRLLFALLFLFTLPAAAQPFNCAESDLHRQFDFWVGEWTVSNTAGNTAGENTITRGPGDCVLVENWRGNGGSTGQSFNYVDAETGTWRQLWVDGGGGHMDFEGALVDGSMAFEGTFTNGRGGVSLMRMTFTPLEDGRVRQFFEQSTDDGATWNTWFEGFYARKSDG